MLPKSFRTFEKEVPGMVKDGEDGSGRLHEYSLPHPFCNKIDLHSNLWKLTLSEFIFSMNPYFAS